MSKYKIDGIDISNILLVGSKTYANTFNGLRTTPTVKTIDIPYSTGFKINGVDVSTTISSPIRYFNNVATTNITIGNNVKHIRCWGLGGGGGGGGGGGQGTEYKNYNYSTNNGEGGGDGGPGSYGIRMDYPVNAGQTISVTIGDSGAAGLGGNDRADNDTGSGNDGEVGSAGGDTIISVDGTQILIATGGDGGPGGLAGNANIDRNNKAADGTTPTNNSNGTPDVLFDISNNIYITGNTYYTPVKIPTGGAGGPDTTTGSKSTATGCAAIVFLYQN